MDITAFNGTAPPKTTGSVAGQNFVAALPHTHGNPVWQLDAAVYSVLWQTSLKGDGRASQMRPIHDPSPPQIILKDRAIIRIPQYGHKRRTELPLQVCYHPDLPF